ncbi:hypothetical protein GH714_040879 [Hevea brasiliensis]|uniref:Flavin-containing monooxygenase n=1 Tax=Hevea brasiliensis TaxID=3981 RepID=A0A6A6MLE3_HEVBR|nr:hypothetical protein GH714_040879 [Hevea brasiliensis]
MVSDLSLSKNVCVIGAGPSGLVAARELRKEGHKVVVLEQKHDVGGQWLYEPNVEKEDPLGRNKFLEVHSSIYASLNIPKGDHGLHRFPIFGEEGRDMRRFPGHRELWLYLKDFCHHFGLREMIRFNTRVEYVGMLDYGDQFKQDLKWAVKSRAEENNGNYKEVEEVFDAVVVATGHYSHPLMPTIKGMDTWKRKQMHSHIYRVPEPFRNEWARYSMELVKVAKEVHLSAKSLDITLGLSKVISKRENLHLRPQIESLEQDGRVVFADGSQVTADTILYCTGYTYTFPFLDTKGMVSVEDGGRVGPLYEHTFPPSLAPSLSFVGIPRKIIGFPFFESQAKWIAQLLSGKRRLPSWDDMMLAIKEFHQSRDAAGVPKHKTHDIADLRYADHVGFPHLEEWRKQLCLSAIVNADANLETYRDSLDDHDLLQEAFQSTHFTPLLGVPDFTV